MLKVTKTCLPLAVLLAAFISYNVYADNDTVVDEVNIIVPVACTLTGSGMNSHTATINPGTSNSNIGTTNMKVLCNDSNGFAVYAIGYTNNTDGNNNLASTTLTTPVNIATGTATSGNSQWAMKLSTVTSPTPAYPITIQNSFDSFHTVPDDYTLVAKRTSATDLGQNAEGSNFSSTYQAFIASTQPADTYVGQVKYVLVHPNDAPAPVACKPNGTTIGTNTNTDIKCMQDISSTNKASILSSMTQNTQYQLVDSRDQKAYYVAKLADGNIWMTQNLDFDIVNGGAAIDSTNTDVPSNWADAGDLTDTYTTNDTTWDTGPTYGLTEPESYDPGDLCWNGTIDDTWSGTISTMTGPCTGTAGRHYHLGNYYNWTAAVAMADSSSYTTLSTNVNQSLCPAGWTLPKIDYNISGSFEYLADQANLTVGVSGNIHTPPYYFVYGGSWNGSMWHIGGGGNYWHPIVSSGYNSFRLNFSADGYVATVSNDRSDGSTLRCLVR